MKKQATIGSVMESFSKFYKTASDSTQGFSEAVATAPDIDKETKDLLIVPGVTLENNVSEVVAKKTVPVTELVRTETPASTSKVAAGSVEELISRLSSNLNKIASEEITKVESPKAEIATGDIDMDVLARKTAEFMQASKAGYEAASLVFGTAKQAHVSPVEVKEDFSEKVAEMSDFVFNKIAAQVETGVISNQQAEVILTDLGYETNTVKIAAIEDMVNERVNSLIDQHPGITTEQVCSILQKDAEADAAAMQEEEGEESEESEESEGSEDQAKQLQMAIAQLQEEVAAGRMTEEQALQFLQEGGLDVEGILSEAAQATVQKDPTQEAHELQLAIAKLQEEVAAGRMTEEESLQILQESGLDVEGILSQVAGEGQMNAAAAEMPPEEQAAMEQAVDQKVAYLKSNYPFITEEQIFEVLQKDAEADVRQAQQSDMSQQLQQIIAELQQAVESGQMTEEQALQLLEESGLDVQGLLQAAQQEQAQQSEAVDPRVAQMPEEMQEKQASISKLIEAADVAYQTGSLTDAQANAMVAALRA